MINKGDFLQCVTECIECRYLDDNDFNEKLSIDYLLDELNNRIKSYIKDNSNETI